MSNTALSENLKSILSQLTETALSCEREADSVKLVAVSKTKPMEMVEAAFAAGQRDFGENYPQELKEKAEAFSDEYVWHFIGRLQSNKVRTVVCHADWIHSVGNEKILDRINRIAEEEGKRPSILIQVNVSGEASKAGADEEAAANLLGKALQCGNIVCRGFMTMAPFDAEEEELHAVFRRTRELRDSLEERFSCKLPELSMGMSGDFKIAVSEGATIVRVGSSIFGARNYR